MARSSVHHPPRTLLLAAVLAVTAFASAGCTVVTPETPPDLRGTVENCDSTGPRAVVFLGTIHVVGKIEEGIRYERASVTITRDSRILHGTGGRKAYRARYSDIRRGDTVEVWFSGPVDGSYPAQGTAGTVVIIE